MLNVDLNNTKRQYEISVDSQLAVIESWMTSLKKHTIDYNENTFLNIKNIPSRYTSWCGSELIDEMGILNNNNDSSNNNNTNNNSNDYNLNVVTYRTNDQLIRNNVTTKRLCQFFNIIVGDDDEDDENDSDNGSCALNNNSYHLQNDHVNSKKDILIFFNQNYCKKIDLKNCLHNLCLSVSLNPIVIRYDDKLKFLVDNRIKYNIKGHKNLVKKYFQILKYIDHKNSSINYNNNNSDCNKKINYFVKNSIENYSLKRKNILDYEIKYVNSSTRSVTDANLTIDDFVFKTINNYNNNNNNNNNMNYSGDQSKMRKSFSDFCLTPDDDSENKIEMMAQNYDRPPVVCHSMPEDFHSNRVVKRDTLTKNRIKKLNNYRCAMGREEVNDRFYAPEADNIYQPIWKFQTIGDSPDNDNTDISMQANLALPDDISDSDNWSNAEQDFAFHNFSFIDENDNSLEYIDAGSIDKQCCEINNDSNSNNNNNCDNKIMSSPYSKVTIFYNLSNHMLNQIKYNWHNNIDNNRLNINQQINSNSDQLFHKYVKLNHNNYNKTIKEILNSKLPKNLANWQLSLLNYNLMEDEEDVIMTERSVNDTISQDHASRNGKDVIVIGKGPSFTETKIFGFGNSKSISNTEKIAGIDSPPEGKFTPKKFPDDLELNYGPPKSNDPESETTSLKSSTPSLKESPKLSPTNSEKVFEKIKPKDKEKKKEKDKVFGVDLDRVELDPEHKVPKFVVECIKIIEENENIETNGIYRASGNKNNIENIKKKMNEKRYMSKESKYSYLQNQDLHTITGALKLFFRETSDLIPEEVFANLPKNLSWKENLETVKTQINTLDEVRFETLKYLMKHLRKVHENNAKNLMTSSNLSIIWGASLFTKSVNSIMSLIENDIMNRNVLIRVLIDNYDYVFNENLFPSDNLSSSISNINSPPNNNNDIVVNQR